MEQLFYFPDRENYGSPKDADLDFETVTFKSADGTQLSGWFIPAVGVSPEKVKGAVLHVHGNAQNMTAQWQYAHWLPCRGYNVFVFDYRGYGKSHGKPDDKGVFEDTVAALDYLRARKDVASNNIYVFGQSLGGMLAIAAVGASPKGVRAVFSEAPFYSYGELADDRMPGEAPFFDDTYCACNYVQKISPCPLLLIHGTADKIVPYSHSVKLFELAKEPKQFVSVENGEHLDIMTQEYGDTYKDMMDDFFMRAAQLK